MSSEQKPLERQGTRPEAAGKSDNGRVAILGLGNILLSDEGVGVHTINVIKERYVFFPAVDIIDGGTMGLDLLPIFQDSDRILIIDAVDLRKPVGFVAVIEGDDIPSVLNAKLSVHHIGLSDLLFTAKLTRAAPSEVCLIGIQPKSLEAGLDMTEQIRVQLDNIISLAVKRLTAWGVDCSLK